MLNIFTNWQFLLGAFQIVASYLATPSKPQPQPPSVKHGGVAKIKKKISAKKSTQFERQFEMHPFCSVGTFGW
jgi:hypothetical protein